MMPRQPFGGSEPLDLEAIRQSPRQFVDLETVEKLSDYAMVCELKIERLTDDVEKWKADSAAAWNKCEERRLENVRLTTDLAHVRQANANYRRENQIAVEELAALKAQSEPVEYKVGRLYERLDGVVVRIVGTGNDTIVDEEGIHYYNRPGDRGRVTGTAHDYSYPKNLVRLYTTPQPASAEVERDAERYRWLRQAKCLWDYEELHRSAEEFDAAIDAAIAKQKGT